MQSARPNTMNRESLLHAHSIPGMIEPIEAEILYELSQSVDIGKEECVVELGAFFGKSTAYIAEGIKQSTGFKAHKLDQPPLVTYDLFSTSTLPGAGFPDFVTSFARRGGVDEKLSQNNNRLYFKAVCEHYLSQYIDEGVAKLVEAPLSRSYHHDARRISMMHIDSPKHYEELRFAMYRFFPSLTVNAHILFQDFFYHWSSGIIAAIELLIKKEYLEPIKTAASTLACRAKRPLTLEAISEVDMILSNKNERPSLIRSAVSRFQEFRMDRKDYFLPRLVAALLQCYHETGDHVNCAAATSDYLMLLRSSQNYETLLSDYRDLVSNNFSIREFY